MCDCGGVRMTQKCPFCGGEDLEIGRGTKDREGWPTYCYCLCCGAQGPWVYINDVADLTLTNLIAEKTGWNKQYFLAEVERLKIDLVGQERKRVARECVEICNNISNGYGGHASWAVDIIRERYGV